MVFLVGEENASCSFLDDSFGAQNVCTYAVYRTLDIGRWAMDVGQ